MPRPARPTDPGHGRRPRRPRAGRAIQQLGSREGAAGARAGRGDPRVRPQPGPGAESATEDLLKVLPEGHGRPRPGRVHALRAGPADQGEERASGGRPATSASCWPRASRCGWSTWARPSPSTTPSGRWRAAIGAGQESPAAASPPPAGLGAAGPPPADRHDHRDHRPRWLSLLHPLGGAARRPARDGAAGAVRPGHRPACAVPARTPHRARSAEDKSDRRLLLAVGGVAYDQEPKPLDDEKTRLQLLAARPAETRRGARRRLDATCRARSRSWTPSPGWPRAAMSSGSRAPRRARPGCSSELPRARWAHIATHGFFADPAVRSVLQPDPKLFTSGGPRDARRRPAQPAGPLRVWCWPGPTGRAAGDDSLAARRPGHPDRRGHRRAALAGPRPGRPLRLRDRPGAWSAAARGSSASSAPSTSPAPTTSSPASGGSTTRPPPP